MHLEGISMQSQRIGSFKVGLILLAVLALLAAPASALAVSSSSRLSPAITGDTVLFSDDFDQPGRVLGQHDGWTVTHVAPGTAILGPGHLLAPSVPLVQPRTQDHLPQSVDQDGSSNHNRDARRRLGPGLPQRHQGL